MSTRDALVVALLVALAGCATTAKRETPNLGRAATPAQVAGWDISIPPDGAGLPAGGATAVAGAAVYEQKCQSCHGAKGGIIGERDEMNAQTLPKVKMPNRDNFIIIYRR